MPRFLFVFILSAKELAAASWRSVIRVKHSVRCIGEASLLS